HRGAFESLMRKHHMKNCATYIDELTTQQVVDAYFGGYEIEETFEVGDWVVYDNGVERGYGYKTNQIKDVDEQKAYFDEGRRMHLTSLRHATPEEIAEEKQRRWWSKHSREVWELKEGDCLISKHDRHSCRIKFVEAVDENSVLLVDGVQDEFYEDKHALELMCDKYKVFCFVEDRKDLEA